MVTWMAHGTTCFGGFHSCSSELRSHAIHVIMMIPASVFFFCFDAMFDGDRSTAELKGKVCFGFFNQRVFGMININDPGRCHINDLPPGLEGRPSLQSILMSVQQIRAKHHLSQATLTMPTVNLLAKRPFGMTWAKVTGFQMDIWNGQISFRSTLQTSSGSPQNSTPQISPQKYTPTESSCPCRGLPRSPSDGSVRRRPNANETRRDGESRSLGGLGFDQLGGSETPIESHTETLVFGNLRGCDTSRLLSFFGGCSSCASAQEPDFYRPGCSGMAVMTWVMVVGVCLNVGPPTWSTHLRAPNSQTQIGPRADRPNSRILPETGMPH